MMHEVVMSGLYNVGFLAGNHERIQRTMKMRTSFESGKTTERLVVVPCSRKLVVG